MFLLAEDLRKAHHRDGIARDDVSERLARAYRRQLIDIADEEQGGAAIDGFHQGMHQRDVDHRGLVDHEEIAGEGICLVAPELPGLRIGLEQAVNGLGLAPRGVGYALCGAAGWGAEEDIEPFRCENRKMALTTWSYRRQVRR